MPVAAKTTWSFWWYLFHKRIIYKYLKENPSSELYLHFAFKYFANLCFIPKLFSKYDRSRRHFSSGSPGMNVLTLEARNMTLRDFRAELKAEHIRHSNDKASWCYKLYSHRTPPAFYPLITICQRAVVGAVLNNFHYWMKLVISRNS